MKKFIIGLIIGIILGLVGLGIYDSWEQKTMGSAVTGQDYKATSTIGNGIETSQVIKKGSGSLGSVIVTATGNLAFTLYDATTTVLHGRMDYHRSTSSIFLAQFPNAMATGTYVFDVEFVDGLYIDINSGTSGTSTITYR